MSLFLSVSPPFGLIVGIIIPVVVFIIVLVLTILKTLKWAKRKKEFFEKLGQVGVKTMLTRWRKFYFFLAGTGRKMCDSDQTRVDRGLCPTEPEVPEHTF